MDHDDFEGTLVLEKMAEINQLEAFLGAIDDDDFAKVKRLLLKAGIDGETVRIVLEKVASAEEP